MLTWRAGDMVYGGRSSVDETWPSSRSSLSSIEGVWWKTFCWLMDNEIEVDQWDFVC